MFSGLKFKHTIALGHQKANDHGPTITTLIPDTSPLAKAKVNGEIDIKREIERQWTWAVAEEMLSTSDERRISQILEEVGRMDVWLDSVADSVKVIKEKLDTMEEEGGIVLKLEKSES